MITLRNGVAAFLRNDGQYLLLKRAANKKIAPGVWSGIGGHMEPHEINDPVAACYREIEEETGISKDQISSLELLYIITRRHENEIRQSYLFFGETARREIVQTDEGALFWVAEDALLEREYSKTFAAALAHYVQRSGGDRAIYVGVARDDNGKLSMNWSKCDDFEP